MLLHITHLQNTTELEELPATSFQNYKSRFNQKGVLTNQNSQNLTTKNQKAWTQSIMWH